MDTSTFSRSLLSSLGVSFVLAFTSHQDEASSPMHISRCVSRSTFSFFLSAFFALSMVKLDSPYNKYIYTGHSIGFLFFPFSLIFSFNATEWYLHCSLHLYILGSGNGARKHTHFRALLDPRTCLAQKFCITF